MPLYRETMSLLEHIKKTSTGLGSLFSHSQEKLFFLKFCLFSRYMTLGCLVSNSRESLAFPSMWVLNLYLAAYRAV